MKMTLRPLNRKRLDGLLAEVPMGDARVVLCQPQTYMNLSGECVAQLLSWYKCPLENLLVIYDDIDLPLGKLRVRKTGSAGTHNGMRSIIYDLQEDGFPRIRIGIGGDRKGDLADYVISGFHGDDKKIIEDAIVKAADAAACLAEHGVDRAMADFNTKTQKKKKQKEAPEGAGGEEAAGAAGTGGGHEPDNC